MVLFVLQQVQPETPWHWIALAIAAVGEVLSVVFVLRVLARGGSPSSTVLWVVVILAAPWFGLLAYYLFPRRLQLKRLRRLKERQAQRPSRARGFGDLSRRNDADGTLTRLLLRFDDDAVTDGNAVTWLPSGRDFFDAAAAAIARARRFVHCQTYIFRADATGRRFLELLTAAAARGVEIRLLFDSFGSLGLKNAELQALRTAGGRAEAFLPLLWRRRPFTVNLRNHRKILVVDGEVAFTGGRNIGDEYATDRLGRTRQWLDAMVRIDGPAVARMHHLFAEDWYNATEEDVLAEGRVAALTPVAPVCGQDRVGVVRSGPDRDVPELWYAMVQAIADARSTVDISSPYVVPPPAFVLAMSVAAARGVRVRVHTNGAKVEAPILYHAQRSYYRELLTAGIEVYETLEDYNHAKVCVVDGRTVLVGSANLDMRSAHLNFEAAVVLPESPALALAILETLGQRCVACRRIREEDLSRDPIRKTIEGLCRLLSPVL
ncbi:MAG: cardiolipin synthase [Planctomycetes bacterium]|nr:cardiolipin synthase [Planctomycetota bacterium]